MAHRKSGVDLGFEEPVNVGMLVNSEFNDYGPALTAAGDRLYFSSNRPQPEDAENPDPAAWPGTICEDVYQRTYDLYWTPINDRGVAQAEPLNLLNTPFNEGAPAVSPFGDFLYFASDRKGGEGGFDVYRSRVIDGTPKAAISLGPTVNTKDNELDPGLTMGGYTLLFSSDRPIEADAPDFGPSYHLFKTVSREVYRRTETTRASRCRPGTSACAFADVPEPVQPDHDDPLQRAGGVSGDAGGLRCAGPRSARARRRRA